MTSSPNNGLSASIEEWPYDYRIFTSKFPKVKREAVAQRLLERYSKHTKAWTADKNSEWFCRLYFSAKLIMAATLHINALQYAAERNLRVVIPYLRYYSALSTIRAIHLTLPEVEWAEGGVLTASHTVAIDRTIEFIRSLDSDYSKILEEEISRLKEERELISYRAPSSGDREIQGQRAEVELCTLFSEVAQFNSELLRQSLARHASSLKFEFKSEYFEHIYLPTVGGQAFFDEHDHIRLGQFARKNPRLSNIRLMMREGHVDDFFGSWLKPDDDVDDIEEVGVTFNPDQNHLVIFDIP